MHNNYILRTETELFSFYRVNGGGIVYRLYSGGRWSGESMIVENARAGYSVTQAADGAVYLFCQDVQGDVVMSVYKDGAWNTRVVLKNPSNNNQSVLLYPMITDGGLCIIYNVQTGEERGGYIVMQRLDKEGRWLPASRIDKFYEMNGTLYNMQQLTNEHLLLFYQTKTPENNLVYREITPERQSGVKIIHSTSYVIVDSAYLTADDGIHALYIVKSMFSSQLVYRQKMSEQFSAQIVLCEGQSIQNCLLYFLKDNLYATFINNSQLYCCVSEDRGITFSRPVRYMSKMCLDPVKAVYLDSGMAVNMLYCRQVYVDRNNPWHVQILPEMYEDFLPRSIRVQNAVPAVAVSGHEEAGRYAELIERLRNQITLLEKQNTEKDRQLINLTGLLKAKNDEIVSVELARKEMSKKYEEDIENMRAELERLMPVTVENAGGDEQIVEGSN